MQLIKDTSALAALSKDLAKAPYAAVDTEFLRETTYWPKLCLIQVAAPGVEAIIDPLSAELDLKPFLDVLALPSVTKVFHAARQDLEIFLNLMGQLPAPVFDVQIAAMACGLGDSIAYDALVEALLKRKIDKSHRFTDWSRRPLSEAQLAYALADVTHLRDLYPALRERLAKDGREEWISEEKAALLDPDAYDTNPENAWRRLKLRKWNADYVAALRAVAAWREKRAQERNVPRARILKDDALQELAEQRPKSVAAMERLRAVPKGFGNSRHGPEIVQALEEAAANQRAPIQVERPAPLPAGRGPTVELLKVLLRCEAERHQVAPRLIANAADIEAIAADDNADVPALKGWRRKLFGEAALKLKQGKLGLLLKNGHVTVQEVNQ
ncbi:MAG: ribonuclease D [Hyphomonadaceae bacterium]|nr:ribonuclease D [Hyphomonadaceae bacterium]